MATLYVDYLNGADTNTGGTNDPLKTIAHAIGSHANNGDTLLLRGSSAYNTIYHERGISTSKTNLTIQADTGHAPVLSSSTLYTSWVKTGGATNVYETTYTPGAVWAVWNDATKLTSKTNVANCDAATNSYYFDNPNDKLYVNIGGGTPANIEVLDANAYQFTFSGAGTIIRELIFQWMMQAHLYPTGGSMTVDRCTFRYQHAFSTGGAFSAIYITSSTHTITNCTFSGSFVDVTHFTNAIEGTAASNGIAVSDCTFTGCRDGVHIDGGTHTVDRCVFTGCANCGVLVDGGTVTVTHCSAVDNGHGGFESNGTGTLNTYYCTVNYTYDCPAPITGALYGFVLHANGVLYHNIVANLKRTTKTSLLAYNLATAGTVTLVNCIAYNCGIGIGHTSDGPPLTFSADYNCFNYNTTNYQVGYTPGSHDVTGDPDFLSVDSARDDFHLGNRSSCIDAGLSVVGVTEGFRGISPDIGRYEYVRPVVHRRRR